MTQTFFYKSAWRSRLSLEEFRLLCLQAFQCDQPSYLNCQHLFCHTCTQHVNTSLWKSRIWKHVRTCMILTSAEADTHTWLWCGRTLKGETDDWCFKAIWEFFTECRTIFSICNLHICPSCLSFSGQTSPKFHRARLHRSAASCIQKPSQNLLTCSYFVIFPGFHFVCFYESLRANASKTCCSTWWNHKVSRLNARGYSQLLSSFTRPKKKKDAQNATTMVTRTALAFKAKLFFLSTGI